MPSRRAFVGGLTAAVAPFGGCLGGVPTASNRAADADGTEQGDSADGEPTPQPTPGGGGPVSVSKTVEDAAYVPENETVRIVARHTNNEAVEDGSEPPKREPLYEEIPWERWAETECTHVAGKAVTERLTETFGEDHGASVAVLSGWGDGYSVSVQYEVTYNLDGEKLSETNVAFDRLVATTPRAVTATVTLDGRTATRTVLTWVRYLEATTSDHRPPNRDA